jgi:bifunctional DNA-binding transcriptional regulator/antitoxin component of YhaV-PrlF toxin-antitoxin module
MGYLSKVQLIERANKTRQFYLICPAPLAEALELEKGEPIEWIVEDRHTLIVRRQAKAVAKNRRTGSAR